MVFWTGVGLLAAGIVGMVAAVTWERESDLSDEYRTVRLGRDLAPCGTDPIDTILPIAECQVNAGCLGRRRRRDDRRRADVVWRAPDPTRPARIRPGSGTR